jgi:hypothetical protein
MEKKATVSPLVPPRYKPIVSEKHGHDNPYGEGWIGKKACLLTIETIVSVAIARLDITAGLPERDLPMWCGLQTAPGETHAVMKKSL